MTGVLYPCVGLRSRGGSVEVNFGHKKFKYEGNKHLAAYNFLIFYLFYFNITILWIAITDNDIDEDLKKKWVEVLNPWNGELISQQIGITKLVENIAHILSYQGKFYFIMGRYE